jgi:hypothetical protein
MKASDRLDYPPRRPDLDDVACGLTLGTVFGRGGFASCGVLFRNPDFGPFDPNSGIPRGDFFFMNRFSGLSLYTEYGKRQCNVECSQRRKDETSTHFGTHFSTSFGTLSRTSFRTFFRPYFWPGRYSLSICPTSWFR